MKFLEVSRIILATINIVANLSCSFIVVVIIPIIFTYLLVLAITNIVLPSAQEIYISIYFISVTISTLFFALTTVGVVGNCLAICTINICLKRSSCTLLIVHLIGLSILSILGLACLILISNAFSRAGENAKEQADVPLLILYHRILASMWILEELFIAFLIILEVVLIVLVKFKNIQEQVDPRE